MSMILLDKLTFRGLVHFRLGADAVVMQLSYAVEEDSLGHQRVSSIEPSKG